jgi:hypothetical protein
MGPGTSLDVSEKRKLRTTDLTPKLNIKVIILCAGNGCFITEYRPVEQYMNQLCANVFLCYSYAFRLLYIIIFRE